MSRRPYIPPADAMAARQIDRPCEGHWLVRLVKGGPLVPARIARVQTTHDPVTGEPMDRSPHWHAEIAGEVVAVDDVWHRRGQPITEAEYRYRLADMAWAAEHAPTEPVARPRQRVDFATMPIPF